MTNKTWIFCIVCLCLTTAIIGHGFGTQSMEAAAIENGAAYYHPETRVFTWGKL